MSTSWSKVFDKFLTLVDDRTLCSLLTDEDMTELLSIFLNGGISLYFKKCKKDLTDIVEPEFLRETSTGDGSNHDFTISSGVGTFATDSYEMYCEVDGTVLESTDYTYVDATKTFTITTAPSMGDEVIRGYNFVGMFTETLTDEELWIIAHAMIIIWHSNKLFNLEKMKNRLSSKDFNNFSPANLLEKLTALYKVSIRQIKTLTISYSYNNFEGFN